VIMVTVVDNQAMGFDLGASNYLIKPVDRDRLAVLIEKHRVARSSTAVEAKVSSRPAATREEQRPIEVEVSRRT
jgi:DNA-binding LytR/AlgR family response regulator